jgi:hypothetical protein
VRLHFWCIVGARGKKALFEKRTKEEDEAEQFLFLKAAFVPLPEVFFREYTNACVLLYS